MKTFIQKLYLRSARNRNLWIATQLVAFFGSAFVLYFLKPLSQAVVQPFELLVEIAKNPKNFWAEATDEDYRRICLAASFAADQK